MLRATGLGLEQMPRLVEGCEVSAHLSGPQAAAWGLGPDVIVAGGAGDNAASAIGVGALQCGQGFVSLGTSGVIFRVGERFEPAPERAVHAFAHAMPGMWHQMAVMLSAASALAWLVRLTGQSEATLSDAVAKLPSPRRAKAPLFLPYLQGERTPHNNPLLPASFTGLRAEHDVADLAYAVMEGVSFGLLDGWRVMGQTTASDVSLALVGGGARSAAWAQILANTLQCPLHRSPESAVAAALGAARLAWMADTGARRLLDTANTASDRFLVQDTESALLQERYEAFGHGYAALHTQRD